MAFSKTFTDDPRPISSGEIKGINYHVLTATDYEDGLVSGRFAKIDAGSLDNLDASANPVIAGVVLRRISEQIEEGSILDSEIFSEAEFIRAGMVTVDAIAGESPSMFQAVFAHNAAGADIGKATLVDDGDTEPTGAEYIENVADNVWLIRLK